MDYIQFGIDSMSKMSSKIAITSNKVTADTMMHQENNQLVQHLFNNSNTSATYRQRRKKLIQYYNQTKFYYDESDNSGEDICSSCCSSVSSTDENISIVDQSPKTILKENFIVNSNVISDENDEQDELIDTNINKNYHPNTLDNNEQQQLNLATKPKSSAVSKRANFR